MKKIEVVCPFCGTSNTLIYDAKIAYEKLDCSACGVELGRLSDLHGKRAEVAPVPHLHAVPPDR